MNDSVEINLYINNSIIDALNNTNIKLTVEKFKMIWQFIKSLDSKRNFMLSHLNIITPNMFQSCFSDLKEWYDKLDNRFLNHVVEIENSYYDRQLSERLEKIGYISKYEVVNDNILKLFVKKLD